MGRELKLLIEKGFSEDLISVEKVRSKMKFDASISRRIDEKWAELLRVAKRDNLLMFNGPLVRLEGFSDGDKLTFFVSETCFKDVMGARPAQDIYDKYGMDYLANSFSVFSVVVTSDGKIPVFRRKGTADFNDIWSLPCGFVHPENDGSNPCRTAKRTAAKDLCIEEKELKSGHFMGLYEYPNISETTACFRMKADLDSKKIGYLAKTTNSIGEALYSELIFIDDTSSAIKKFLSEHENDSHPGTLLALGLHIK